MADPLTLLAPPVEPLAPVLDAASASGVDVAWVVAPGLALAIAVLVAARAWWHRRWARDLRRVLRECGPLGPVGAGAVSGRPDAATARTPARIAERLAQAARRRAVTAPAAWWQALDAIRFGRPMPEHVAQLQGLLAEAQGFVPRDRLLARGNLRWSRRRAIGGHS